MTMIYFEGTRGDPIYDELAKYDTTGPGPDGAPDGALDNFELETAGGLDQVMDALVGSCFGITPRGPFGEYDIVRIANDECMKAEQAAASGDDKVTQCPKGMTFAAAGERVSEAFCVDNEATQTVNGEAPNWYQAKDFCEAAGKFLLTYEQHRLAARSTPSAEVKNSYDWEWVLSSRRDDREGQVGGFFYFDFYRSYDGEDLSHSGPGNRRVNIAFRCGVVPSPQDSKE